jgi:hypothetical protein
MFMALFPAGATSLKMAAITPAETEKEQTGTGFAETQKDNGNVPPQICWTFRSRGSLYPKSRLPVFSLLFALGEII